MNKTLLSITIALCKKSHWTFKPEEGGFFDKNNNPVEDTQWENIYLNKPINGIEAIEFNGDGTMFAHNYSNRTINKIEELDEDTLKLILAELNRKPQPIVYLRGTHDAYNLADVVDGTLTVGDLINMLDDFADDTKVVFRFDNGYTYGFVGYDSVNYEMI